MSAAISITITTKNVTDTGFEAGLLDQSIRVAQTLVHLQGGTVEITAPSGTSKVSVTSKAGQ